MDFSRLNLVVGAFYVAGGIAGRFKPLRVWGPSGATRSLGAKAAIELAGKCILGQSRSFGPNRTSWLPTEIHEFDYKKEQVVYKENGVTIHSFPAIHTVSDVSVSVFP